MSHKTSSTHRDGRGGTVNRRTVLKAGAIASVSGLAGCISGSGSSGGGTIKVGITGPMSGPLSNYGQSAAEAIPLAIQHAKDEGDTGDFDIQLLDTLDDKENPTQAINNMNTFIENGVDFVNGMIGGVTTLPAGKVGQQKDVIVHGLSGPKAVTGPECRPMVFAVSESVPQQDYGGLGYVLRNNMGSKVYQMASDNAWGNEHMDNTKNNVIPNAGAEHLKTVIVPLGTTSFAQHLTEARQMGADVLYLALDPPGYIATLKEAQANGMLDAGLTVSLATVTLATGSAIPEILANYEIYMEKDWVWTLDNQATKDFSKAYMEKYNKPPRQFGAEYYVSTRTILKAYGEAGTTDNTKVRKVIEGHELHPQLWGVGEKFRACDHRGTCPPMTTKALPTNKQDVKAGKIFDVLEIQSDAEKYMVPCSQSGCNMPQ